MSMSNATENAALKMFLQGTDPSYRAGATQYLALVTDAAGAVSEASPVANECTYTGYARVALTKASAWTELDINQNIQPQFSAGDLTITAE